jgi:four helix bundle protein
MSADLLARVELAIDRTIQMAMALPRNIAGQEIGRQVIRSSGSVGANLEEARAAVSREDYTYKVSVSLRESRETLYWIRRIEKNKLLPARRLAELMGEWNELVAIMTTTQKKLRSPKREAR